jgi:hypothetical protein
LQAAVKNTEDIFLSVIFGFKEEIEFFGPAHLHCLGNHHIPGENGKNRQNENDDPARVGGPIPYKLQLCCRKKTNGNAHQKNSSPQPKAAAPFGETWRNEMVNNFTFRPMFRPSLGILGQTGPLATIFRKIFWRERDRPDRIRQRPPTVLTVMD